MPRIESLLHAMKELKASELRLEAGCVPQIAKSGRRVPLPGHSVQTDQEVRDLLQEMLPGLKWAEFQHSHDLGFVCVLPEAGRLRGRLYEHHAGIGAAIYLLSDPPPAELLSPTVSQLQHAHAGIILICGPPRSGKSTTLHALLDGINQGQVRHMLTIEQPISFIHTSRRSLMVQREVGVDVLSTAEALRSALRQDPDVVALDPLLQGGPGPTPVPALLEIAEAGVLVLCTLLAESAAHALDLLVQSAPRRHEERLRQALLACLHAVVVQRWCDQNDEEGQYLAHEVQLYGPRPPSQISVRKPRWRSGGSGRVRR